MFQNLKVRFGVIALAVALSVWFLVRNRITYGLDLQGGVHLALEVDDSKAALSASDRANAIDQALKVVRLRVDELGVAEPLVQRAGSDRIIVELAGDTVNQARAKAIVQKTAFLEFKIVRPGSELQDLLPRLDRAAATRGGAGTAAPAGAAAPAPAAAAPATPLGGLLQVRRDSAAPSDSARASSAGATRDSAGALPLPGTAAGKATPGSAPISSLIAGQGAVGQLIVDTAKAAQLERLLASPAVQQLLPRGTEILWGMPAGEDDPGYRSVYLVDAKPIMTGDQLEKAQAESDQFRRPIVTFQLTRGGGRTFSRATGQNIGNAMAIVLDKRVYTAPTIRSEIGNRGQIELGKATLQEASDLALVLRAGALPAPLRIVEERSVGPSLGKDSITNSIYAGIFGVGLVVLTMIGIYRFSGALAVLALAIYCLVVLGLLAMLNATLTFPGIAGLILSVGMAVDANILIFERTREELEHGRTPRVALSEGFHHALRAIIDSNVTSLITAAILFYTGTGPIRGFAVTFSVGVIASMFTAIFVTRTLFMLYLERRAGARTLSI